jgi:hypothetical protein
MMIQGRYGLPEAALEDAEVRKHPPLVQGFPLRPEPDPVIMAVEIFALPLIMA